ncbi:MAG TPA: Clp protease N-terminal domain-containing protein [Terriglobales bacterium]|nr:Clp protease N-terminal domain-containing protein [Terriglobales bacterium]
MFERYTEKARRVIFFSRYEASHYGSPYIETEHLLLGLIREHPELVRLLPSGSAESIRKQVDDHTVVNKKVSISVDLPLSNECKRVLTYGAEEAGRLSHRHIGTEHLLLGLLREENSFAAAMLSERGMTLEQLRERFAQSPLEGSSRRPFRRPEGEFTVNIHGAPRSADPIQERVRNCRKFQWHWHKRSWTSRDTAVHRATGAVSLDPGLANDNQDFEAQRGGWKTEPCFVCGWELLESATEPEHGIAYTNGRDWVCTECYEKFLQGPDYFATSHPEIT